jgi:hypothetical protein
MIKFAGKTAKGSTIVGFGLSARNLELLQAGRPIRVDVAAMLSGTQYRLPAGLEVVILYGDTEEAIHDELKDSGRLSANMNMHDEPNSEQAGDFGGA